MINLTREFWFVFASKFGLLNISKPISTIKIQHKKKLILNILWYRKWSMEKDKA